MNSKDSSESIAKEVEEIKDDMKIVIKRVKVSNKASADALDAVQDWLNSQEKRIVALNRAQNVTLFGVAGLLLYIILL